MPLLELCDSLTCCTGWLRGGQQDSGVEIVQCMCNRSPPASPSAVGARHVKEVRKGIREVQPCCGLRVIPRGGREFRCMHCRTHPSIRHLCCCSGTGLPGCPACQFTTLHRTVRTVNRKRAADAHASSHMQVQGGPFTAPLPPKTQQAACHTASSSPAWAA